MRTLRALIGFRGNIGRRYFVRPHRLDLVGAITLHNVWFRVGITKSDYIKDRKYTILLHTPRRSVKIGVSKCQ